jgi:two-component system, sensor histidine kinase and response regulator
MFQKPKILVVDDKRENLFAIETVLKGLDVELIKATNGNDALKETLHHDFVLALLDIQMPGMDGYELASILREEPKTANLPFIFISAVYTEPANVFKGYELGAFSFISKPFEPKFLINKVKLFVDKYLYEAALEEKNKELEKKNEQLTEAYKELDFFTFSVSHDLRTPLRFINGYSNILKEDFQEILNEGALSVLEKVSNTAKEMDLMIDELLMYSDLGRRELRKSKIDVNQMASFVKNEVLKEYAAEGITFQIDDLPEAYGDHFMITQVFTNLISNAVKFSLPKPNPEVLITGESKADVNIYKIKDNGVGFNMDYAYKLFGVFQRLHTKEEFEGMGVGLAKVKRIITRHGGNVWVESEIGKGSTFYFSLPKEKNEGEG